MGYDSCTVAMDMEEHHLTIHFKSDEEVRTIYVHPDNIFVKPCKRNWSKRRGNEYTLYQNKIQARASIDKLCGEMRKNKEDWGYRGTDAVLGLIEENIGMSPTLWTSVKVWVKRIVNLVLVGASTTLGVLGLPPVSGLLGWR